MTTQANTEQQFDTLERLSSCTALLETAKIQHEQMILQALAAGNSLRTVAAAAGVTAPTVAAIRDRNRTGG